MSYDPWRPTSMLWTMKYSPRCGDEVIGNQWSVGQMRGWLSEWQTVAKSQQSADGSFCDSSEAASEYSDYSSDGQDCAEVSSNNTALVCGPTGMGKTAAVYALAREMGFKVLEARTSLLGQAALWYNIEIVFLCRSTPRRLAMESRCWPT